MAYYYSLAVECGDSEKDTVLCEQHFKNFSIEVDGSVYDFITEKHIIEYQGDDTHWVVIFSQQLPAYGITDQATADMFTSIGRDLLRHLSKISHFRFSILGVESIAAIQFAEFDQSLVIDKKFVDSFNGLVISKLILSKISNSEVFVDFGTNHVGIIPYQIDFRK